jgi:hypothetical protein
MKLIIEIADLAPREQRKHAGTIGLGTRSDQ